MNPFKSFWWGGYECSDKLNAFGNRVDLLNVTRHPEHIHQDYKDISSLEIRTVREGIRWGHIETRPYHYDWSVVEKMIIAGKERNIQQVWDICHFGFPDDLTPLHPHFTQRFAALCRAFVLFYRSLNPNGVLIVTPINEVSFISWLGGEVKGTTPYCTGQGWEVKYNLMRAYIQGVSALLEADPTVRILTTEPLVNYVPPLDATEEEVLKAFERNENQYQATDILCGRMCPELGGKEEYLDIVGLNFYYNNQWVSGTFDMLPWVNDSGDVRWRPLRSLLADVYERYGRPIALTETSHCGVHKPDWLTTIATECAAVIQKNIPLWGICLYPIIDRPDWDHLHIWHDAGLWSIDPQSENLERVLHQPTAQALYESQELINKVIINDKMAAQNWYGKLCAMLKKIRLPVASN